MNIFFLHPDPKINAQWHVDRHCPKMALEIAQILSNAIPIESAPYRRSHVNHPMAVWVRESAENFDEAWTIAKAICGEYTYRYGKRTVIEDTLDKIKLLPKSEFKTKGRTEPPRCFGDFSDKIPTTSDVYTDYRNYMILGKQHLRKYKNREIPDWFREIR